MLAFTIEFEVLPQLRFCSCVRFDVDFLCVGFSVGG